MEQCARAIFLPFLVMPLENVEFNPVLESLITVASGIEQHQFSTLYVEIHTVDYCIPPPLLINIPLLI